MIYFNIQGKTFCHKRNELNIWNKSKKRDSTKTFKIILVHFKNVEIKRLQFCRFLFDCSNLGESLKLFVGCKC